MLNPTSLPAAGLRTRIATRSRKATGRDMQSLQRSRRSTASRGRSRCAMTWVMERILARGDTRGSDY